jgi:hypothetical protein
MGIFPIAYRVLFSRCSAQLHQSSRPSNSSLIIWGYRCNCLFCLNNPARLLRIYIYQHWPNRPTCFRRKKEKEIMWIHRNKRVFLLTMWYTCLRKVKALSSLRSLRCQLWPSLQMAQQLHRTTQLSIILQAHNRSRFISQLFHNLQLARDKLLQTIAYLGLDQWFSSSHIILPQLQPHTLPHLLIKLRSYHIRVHH